MRHYRQKGTLLSKQPSFPKDPGILPAHFSVRSRHHGQSAICLSFTFIMKWSPQGRPLRSTEHVSPPGASRGRTEVAAWSTQEASSSWTPSVNKEALQSHTRHAGTMQPPGTRSAAQYSAFSPLSPQQESSKVKFIPVALPAPPSQVAHGLGQLTEQRAASRACKGNLRVLQGEPGVRRARGARRAARGWQRPCRPGSSELLVLTELSTGL